MALILHNLSPIEATELLTHGHIDVQGRLIEASNLALYCVVEHNGVTAKAIYKPTTGEQTLWDFPQHTLAYREVATYLLAHATGLAKVPPTVLRNHGPLGVGMVQLWIDTTDDPLVMVEHSRDIPDGWHRILRDRDRLGQPIVLAHAEHTALRDLALFDVVVNNTDRKGRHVLHGTDGHVYGIDHGICLHSEPKLRTVLWGWVGEPLPEESVSILQRLPELMTTALGEQLARYLSAEEIQALLRRAEILLTDGVFPKPQDDWHTVPWPLW